jgi:ATP synthase F1 gamma subunit
MKRAITIQGELGQVRTVEDLTEVFESISSIRIARIRDRVIMSKEFFSELWKTYSGLRVDPKQRLARSHLTISNKEVFLAVTAEGKLSSDADDQIANAMTAAQAQHPDADLIVIGSHGQQQLAQRGVHITAAFPLPQSDFNFNVSDIVEALNTYKHITVFYQTYESLRVQNVVSLSLISAIQNLGEDVEGETVSSHDYIFEPNIDEIADYMESVMMGVALIQIIMESKLAQYASRFNAMSSAKRRAIDIITLYRTQFYRAKRAESDERLKELIKVAKFNGHYRAN